MRRRLVEQSWSEPEHCYHVLPHVVPQTPTFAKSQPRRILCQSCLLLCRLWISVFVLFVLIPLSVPIALALIVLIFLHRRHTRKLKQEDLDDKHKSLDFGLETTGVPSKKGKGIPEMTITDTEKSVRAGKGLSLDVGSPYILPAGLHGSRESFHSMSRSMHDPDDPYRPVTFIKDDASIRAASLRGYRHDNASTYTGSSEGTEKMNGSLLKNAQRMSRSVPLQGDSLPSPQDSQPPQIQFPQPTLAPGNQNPQALPTNPRDGSPSRAPALAGGLAPAPLDPSRDSYLDKNTNDLRKSNNYLGSFIHSRDGSTADPGESTARPQPQSTPGFPLPTAAEKQQASTPSMNSHPSNPRPLPRVQSQEAVVQNPNTASFMSDSSDYGDGFKVTPPSPPRAPSGRFRRRRNWP